MEGIRLVIWYSGLNYNEVLELPTDTFLLMRKNAVIEKLNQTPEGKQYLEDCQRLNTTNIDRKALEEKMKG